MPRILILDDIAAEGIDLLDAAEDVEHEIRTGLSDYMMLIIYRFCLTIP